MHKPRSAIDVRKTTEFDKFFNSLPENSRLKKDMSESFPLLLEDCTKGDNIAKPLIGYYTQKYGVNNAWRYDLSDGGRMVYAIVPESNDLVVYILEGFKTHVEYEKRFGY